MAPNCFHTWQMYGILYFSNSRHSPILGTGKIQPNDVGIQRIFKHIVKTEASAWFMQQVK
jgi:hypothetical protein